MSKLNCESSRDGAVNETDVAKFDALVADLTQTFTKHEAKPETICDALESLLQAFVLHTCIDSKGIMRNRCAKMIDYVDFVIDERGRMFTPDASHSLDRTLAYEVRKRTKEESAALKKATQETILEKLHQEARACIADGNGICDHCGQPGATAMIYSKIGGDRIPVHLECANDWVEKRKPPSLQ